MNREYFLEKGWKCQKGLFTTYPKGTCDCEFCENCDVQKGIIVENAKTCIFIAECDVEKVL